ncbi:hypothetical protein [Methylobacterium oryzihabitans]|uniref:Uncharacterized protein n=1 Tax=Methylobacterium oryzihabitans TaxID=2499852 RepID=A0A3S2VRY4_9HYPH|nr:hypothetical protein [Methylobacterium oryzihabitans]RVU19475.1 hypothetical protein EOE48_08745 [Methylobacterium oryzihabitans]
MQWGLVSGVALACLAGTTTSLRAENTIVLDTFFSGILPRCQGSKSFEQFRTSLADRYGHDANGKRLKSNTPVTAPTEIKPALGSISAKNKGEYTLVLVPLSGTFRSLPVSAVEFVFGNENGYDMTIVRFSASRSKVAQVLDQDIARAKRLLKRRFQAGETGADQSVTLDVEGGQTRLICDTSN